MTGVDIVDLLFEWVRGSCERWGRHARGAPIAAAPLETMRESSAGSTTVFRQPSFPKIDAVKCSYQIRTLRHSILRGRRRDEGTRPVVPSELPREFIPNARLSGVRAQSIFKTPPRQFLICAALPRSLTECVKFHSQKPAQMSVQSKGPSKVRPVFLRKPSVQMQPDFIQHPAKMIKAGNFVAGAAKGRVLHMGAIVSPPHRNASGTNEEMSSSRALFSQCILPEREAR